MTYRKPKTLTHEELTDIASRLKTDETMVSIARDYNMQEGSFRRMLLRLTTDRYFDRANSQRALQRKLDTRTVMQACVDLLQRQVEILTDFRNETLHRLEGMEGFADEGRLRRG